MGTLSVTGALVRAGSKWGAVECTDVDFKTVDLILPGGGDWHGPIKYYFLKCECGNKFQVEVSEFKGKRLTQDCGCGRGRSGKTVGITATIPVGLREAIVELAEREETNFSYTLSKLVRLGLERVETK